MNKSEIQSEINDLEARLSELKTKLKELEISKEQRFIQLMTEGVELKIAHKNYPGSIFGFKKDKYMWSYDSKNKSLYISHEYIWLVFRKEYSLSYEQIQEFIQRIVEEHFNCKGIKTHGNTTDSSMIVEEHFNCKGIKTDFVPHFYESIVEEYFNCNH